MRRWMFLGGAVLMTALAFRVPGLFRGLEDRVYYHPDETKQVAAVSLYLQGRYGFIGNPQYDGYPLGLNHADEVLLRLLLPAHRAVLGSALADEALVESHPAHPLELTSPPMEALYYWVRALRVLYALVAVLLIFLAGRAIGLPPAASWAAAAVYALHPLALVVSHAGTGDIGVDLMTAAFLFLLARGWNASRRETAWFVAAGVAVGFGFTCKFQAVLVLYVPALCFAWDLVRSRAIRPFLRRCTALGLIGIPIGLCLGMPHALAEPRSTFRMVLKNFAIIKDYGVNAEALPDSFIGRAWMGLHSNFVPLCLALSVPLLAVALAYAVFRMLDLARRRRQPQGREDVLCAAVATYPFVAMLIGLAGKPAIQFFHFSSLLVPLALTTGMIAAALSAARRPVTRRLAAAVPLALLAVLGCRSWQENRFWRREDLLSIARRRERALLSAEAGNFGRPRPVAEVAIEPPRNLSDFRNRPVSIVLPDGDLWRAVDRAPVPAVPFPGLGHWIVADGPVLARDDRCFRVPRGSCVSHSVSAPAGRTSLALGLRSGALPTVVELSGVRGRILLPPHSQTAIPWTSSGAGPILRRLDVRATTGDAWITVLGTDAQAAAFRLFGGCGTVADMALLVAPWKERPQAAARLACARMYEGAEEARLSGGRPVRLLDHAVLPAGRYVLDIVGRGPPTPVRLALMIQPLAHEPMPLVATNATPVEGRIVLRFAKGLAPFDGGLFLRAGEGGAFTMQAWTLRPDADALLADLSAGRLPPWAAPPPPAEPRSWKVDCGSLFRIEAAPAGGAVVDGSLHLPMHVSLLHAVRGLEHYCLFVHLRDRDGRQVHAAQVPLPRAMDPRGDVTVSLPSSLAPGDYTLWTGIYDTRTQRRLALLGAAGAAIHERRMRFPLRLVRERADAGRPAGWRATPADGDAR